MLPTVSTLYMLRYRRCRENVARIPKINSRICLKCYHLYLIVNIVTRAFIGIPIYFQAPWFILLTQCSETILGFGASLFGNRFIYRNQYMPTKPGLAYKLRKPYAQKHGSFGDTFINMVRFV